MRAPSGKTRNSANIAGLCWCDWERGAANLSVLLPLAPAPEGANALPSPAAPWRIARTHALSEVDRLLAFSELPTKPSLGCKVRSAAPNPSPRSTVTQL